MQYNMMAVVRVTYIKPGKNLRGRVQDYVKYMQNRRGKDGAKVSRSLFGDGGLMGRYEAYSLIDEAQEGSRYFRVVINPDVKTEDTKRDLNMREVIETTISAIRGELDTEVTWVAAQHNDHTPQRHIHALVIARTRLLPAPLMIQTATQVCREQRRERDHTSQHELGLTQGKEGPVRERERSK